MIMRAKDIRSFSLAVAVPVFALAALAVSACSSGSSNPTSPSGSAAGGGASQTAARDGDNGVRTRTGFGDDCIQPGRGSSGTPGTCGDPGNGGGGGGGNTLMFVADLNHIGDGPNGGPPYPPLAEAVGSVTFTRVETCYEATDATASAATVWVGVPDNARLLIPDGPVGCGPADMALGREIRQNPNGFGLTVVTASGPKPARFSE